MKKKISEEDLTLFDKIEDIKGIGPKKAEALSIAGITRLEDVLSYYHLVFRNYCNGFLTNSCYKLFLTSNSTVLIITTIT